MHALPVLVLRGAQALPQAGARFGGTEGPDLTRYVTVCAVLLLSIGGLAFLFRKLVGRTLRARAAGRSLQVLDVLPLGGKRRLCVVRCYDRTFALGLADHAVAVVAELDPVIGEERTAPVSAADAASFADLLRRAPASAPRARRGARKLVDGGLLA
jgi:flagellar biogenesis protein FliO